MLQTYQPKKRQRKKVHGFRARMKTHTGAKVVARRRRKGRKVLTAYKPRQAAFFIMKKNPYPKSMRLRRTSEFQYVFRRGQSVANGQMVLLAAPCRGRSRAGFSVGKKVGNSVTRSKVKRWMRESYRLLAPMVRPKVQLVFVARTQSAQASFSLIYDGIYRLLKRSGCLKETDA